uniref:Variant surface glycoprotein 1125.5623 n=1 Tax=Trypanosoma brucei TaxID=5691 RepID=A0A1J0RCS5_9TRYP|nr:variant surface glycoprotein 1125.5623 [Trypanosoma brucei]
MKYISLLIFALTLQSSASALHLYGKQIKKPCDSKYYLDKMAQKANQNVKQALTSTRAALLQAAKQALVGSAANDAKHRLAADIAVASTINNAANTLDRIITNWKQLQAGLAAINQLAATNALVAEVEQTTMRHVDAKTTISAPNPATMATEATIKPADNGYCMKALGQEYKTEAADENTATAKTIKTFVLIAATKATGGTAADFNQVCGLAGQQAITTSTECTSTYTAVGFKGGKILQPAEVTLKKKTKTEPRTTMQPPQRLQHRQPQPLTS